MSSATCFLNGQYLPLADARISVLDRGFIFGDGVYEVIPSFNGKIFRLPQHLSRLAKSLDAVGMVNPYSEADWVQICDDLLSANRGGDQSIYIQVSRGIAPRNHGFPRKTAPSVMAMCAPLDVADPQAIKAICCEDNRWQRCDIKSISLLANVLAREQALQAGAGEAIFIHEGCVSEGAASNVFVVHEGIIKTPPLSPRILAGITRELLIELLARGDSPIQEVMVSQAELLVADEVWITSSTRDLVPVTQIDETRIGTGHVGPVFANVREQYVAFKTNL